MTREGGKQPRAAGDGGASSAAALLAAVRPEGSVTVRGRSLSLHTLLLIGMSMLFAVLFAVFLVVDVNMQRAETERALHEEAQMFAREMDAVWGFMDHAQYTINNTSDGTYEFKGLHCAVVGKSVGAIFSKDNNYTIRYTNYNPRNSQDIPDEFEAEGLDVFYANPRAKEYYGLADYKGEEKFRFLSKLAVDESCLECHGDPVGEIDKTGFPREGWTLDSVGGAISIIIPVDGQKQAEGARIARDAVAFLTITSVSSLFILLLLSFFVMRPLNRMKKAFATMQEGELSIRLPERATVSEVARLIDQFNTMAGELDGMYRSIEGQVRDRTLDLQQANDLLEAQRDDLARLNVQLAKETQFKTDLLSMVNHELRTPLTAIITLAQISREHAQAGGADGIAWAEIENNSRILLDMINDMLDIARSDAGMISATREVMDLGDIVTSVRESLAPIATKYSVSLSTRVLSDVPLVMGDYEKTKRIFMNLVSNAIKFTPDGGHVSMLVSYDRGRQAVRCSVEDNGIGIDPEDQERIFERFVQVDSTSTRKYAGSGLGLAIVRQYAELQGFDVQVESAPGAGSAFTLTIPHACIVEGDF